MNITAQQLFKDLDAGQFRPFYVIAGEEPFQWSEILGRLKQKILMGGGADFQYETWDAEGLDAGALRASLEELPGLFSDGGLRLVVCRNFEKATVASLETLAGYFASPLDSTIFVISCNKLDKRKGWVKAVDEKGVIIEISDPNEREWPKWHGYLEKKVGKRIEPAAWERLVATSQKMLSILWSELTKVATFVGDAPTITAKDVSTLASGEAGEDIFGFAEDVLCKRQPQAVRRYHNLLREGESEIKILSILVRQFRIVQQYRAITKKGVSDAKVIGPQIGVHPYFVSKITTQAKHHTDASLDKAISSLAEADFRLKTGAGSLFESFLQPYFH